MPSHADSQHQMPQLGSAVRSDWPIDFSTTFLNHGSYGSVPYAVHEEAERWRAKFEANPMEWFWRKGSDAVREAVVKVAAFLGADPDHTGFVVNATAAANSALRDMPLEPGQEILLLNHGYNAVKQASRHAVSLRGATVVEVNIPLPIRHQQADIVDRIAEACTDRTALVFIDQVTSPTALRLPVSEVAAMCAERGIPVFVDGAHAPGMLEKPAAGHGGAWWTGNLHKWISAPKGCAIMSIDPAQCDRFHAPVVSHGYEESSRAEFDWQGTRDLAPWLAAPAAIEFWDRYGGIDRVRKRNHELACEVHRMLLERLGVEPISPIDGSMLGSMATVELPGVIKDSSRYASAEQLGMLLSDRYRIEIPILDFGEHWYLRISAQVYNEMDDYLQLADAVDELAREAG